MFTRMRDPTRLSDEGLHEDQPEAIRVQRQMYTYCLTMTGLLYLSNGPNRKRKSVFCPLANRDKKRVIITHV